MSMILYTSADIHLHLIYKSILNIFGFYENELSA